MKENWSSTHFCRVFNGKRSSLQLICNAHNAFLLCGDILQESYVLHFFALQELTCPYTRPSSNWSFVFSNFRSAALTQKYEQIIHINSLMFLGMFSNFHWEQDISPTLCSNNSLTLNVKCKKYLRISPFNKCNWLRSLHADK